MKRKIKEITSDYNVVVFAGGKGWLDSSIIKEFIPAGENIYDYTFDEDQAFFTRATEEEVNAVLGKQDIYDLIDIYSFEFSKCNYEFEDEEN
jgi:hypothetical protein